MEKTTEPRGMAIVSRRAAIKRGLGSGIAAVFTCVAVDPAKAGYGRCSLDSCAGFVEDYNNKEVCSNCGHNYTLHY